MILVIKPFLAKTQTLPNSEDYQDWVPPDRLYAIDILFFSLLIH